MPITSTEITIAHSPDSDDAFMFYGLASNKVNTDGITIKQVHKDIQTLNLEARDALYDVSAISFAVYPEISAHYALMSCGASIGYKYGPILVSKQDIALNDLANITIAIPGKQTTACMVLSLFNPALNLKVLPFDKIIDAVSAGEVDAGLLIHEGQLTYLNLGLKKIIDLGQWWFEETQLPLPLGGNVVRKALGTELMRKATHLFKDSIIYSLENRSSALKYAMSFAPQISDQLADQYIGMYVNDFTVDFGEQGRKAIEKLYEMAYTQGLIKHPVDIEII